MIKTELLLDSISPHGWRLSTFLLTYPRFIHSELMTHRVFSRNAASSRAIPIATMIEKVQNNTAMPIHWGSKQKGMQAGPELTGLELTTAKGLWVEAAQYAMYTAERMDAIGLHKQVANRVLEPFMHMEVLVSATDYSGFFHQRCHPAAQPELQAVALGMQKELMENEPLFVDFGEWHLPFIAAEEYFASNDTELLKKVSSVRCARTSYIGVDGRTTTMEEDMTVFDKLVGDPLHGSPFEHVAAPVQGVGVHMTRGNYGGWRQYRHDIEYPTPKDM